MSSALTRPTMAEVIRQEDGSLEARPLLRQAGRQTLPLSVHGGKAPAHGDLIVVEPQGRDTTTFRSRGKVRAGAGSVLADLYRIAARYGLEPLHPPEVMAETRGIAADHGIGDPTLVDLTALPFITIDNRDSRDLDQALAIERTDDGYLVWYALADASYYVRPGTALFSEALQRGASFYLPGLMIPMLPRLLCEDLVSLNQGQDRRSLVFKMRLDSAARCTATELLRARIHSARKLSYPGVQRYYDDPAGSRLTGQAWTPSLDLLREVGGLLIDAARRRHVISYHRSELEIKLGKQQRLGFSMLSNQRLDVERYNEQISLLCNVQGAELLAGARGLEQVQAIFRVHPAPSPAALDSLAELIGRLIRLHRLDKEPWQWRRDQGQALADYLDGLPRDRYHRLGRVIERQAMLINERSTFEDEPGRHHGIGAPVYARFSAPMREIVGIFTHKEAIEALQGSDGSAPQADRELREQVLAAGNRAKEVQRSLTKDANRMVLDRLFHSELALPAEQRPRRRGTIMGLTGSRLYVQLDDPVVDLKVYVSDLERQLQCRLLPDADEVSLVAEQRDDLAPLRMGDPVTVWLAGLSQRRNRWRFQLQR